VTPLVETLTIRTPDGRDLCVETAGDPMGVPVLVHGGTPNSRHLYHRWIADAERRGIRLLSYDRPGYGGSTAAPGHSVADAAADVQSLADALGIRRLRVWGYSGGGPYALASAALLPELVLAVATVGGLAPYGAPGLDYLAGMGQSNVDDTLQYFADPVAARRKCGEDRERFLGAGPGDIGQGLATLLAPVDAAVLSDDFAQFRYQCRQDGLAPGDQGWWDDGVAQLGPWGFDLTSIQIPVKVWHGRHDRFVPVQHGEWLCDHVPGASAVLSDEDGHLTLQVAKIGDVHEWLLAQT